MTKHHVKNFEVYYFEVNQQEKMTPMAILNYLQETAIAHSEVVGYDLERLKKEGLGWVLNRWDLKMTDYPMWGQKISIDTWISSFNRFYATREFYIKNSEGDVLGKATSLWIFFDLCKRRPRRIPKDLAEAYGVDEQRVIDRAFSDIDEVEDADIEEKYKVRKQDIDTNEHVNNSVYAAWILETIPKGITEEHVLRNLEIIYKKEIGYGNIIGTRTETIQRKGGGYEYRHQVYHDKTGDTLVVAKTAWKRKGTNSKSIKPNS